MRTPADRIFIKRAWRDALDSAGVASGQKGALILILFMFICQPFVRLMIAAIVGREIADKYPAIIESVSAGTTLALILGSGFLYKLATSKRSLLQDGERKVRLTPYDIESMYEYLAPFRGSHLEIHFSHLERSLLALELASVFRSAGWEIAAVSNNYRRPEQQEGLWIWGSDSLHTEGIVGIALDRAFLPYTYEDGSPNQGIILYVGRSPLSD